MADSAVSGKEAVTALPYRTPVAHRAAGGRDSKVESARDSGNPRCRTSYCLGVSGVS